MFILTLHGLRRAGIHQPGFSLADSLRREALAPHPRRL